MPVVSKLGQRENGRRKAESRQVRCYMLAGKVKMGRQGRKGKIVRGETQNRVREGGNRRRRE